MQLTKYANEASASAITIVVLDILFIILLIVISGAIALVLNLRKKQSQALQEKLNAINNQRDLTIAIEKLSNDDLGKVVELINQLIAEFRHDFQEFQNSANEIASASEQGAQSADRTNRTLIEQEQSLSLSLMSAEGISLAIDEDMKSVSSLTQYAKTSNEMLADGTSKVVSAVNSIRVTSDKVKGVAQVVDKLNESSSIAFNSIAHSASAAGESVSFAEEISEVLQQVGGNMNELERLVENVAQSAEQQSFSLIQVTKEIKLIGEASSENRESAEQIASVSVELSAVAQQMLDNISRYKV